MTPSARAAVRLRSRRRRVRLAALLGSLSLATVAAAPAPTAADARSAEHGGAKPTIVLVHGAWADASSWNRVVRRLQAAGYPVVAPPNPLRSLSSDSAYLDATPRRRSTGRSCSSATPTARASSPTPPLETPTSRRWCTSTAPSPPRARPSPSWPVPDSALSVSDPTTIFNFVPGTLPPTPEQRRLPEAVHVPASRSPPVSSRPRAKALWATQRPDDPRRAQRALRHARVGHRSRAGT